MNGWFREATVAYLTAEELGSKEATMMKAYSLRELDPERAFSVASDYFQDSSDSQAAVTIAVWHFEDGSLEEASTWLDKASLENSARSQTLSIIWRLHIFFVQKEQFTEAKEKLQQLIQLSEQTLGAICCRLRCTGHSRRCVTWRGKDNHRWGIQSRLPHDSEELQA